MCWFAALGTAIGASATATTAFGVSAATMTGLSATAQLVGLGMQAFGAMRGAESQQQAYQYQAAVDRNNAILAERQAADAEQRGVDAEMAHRRKAAELKGTQKAQMAARGLDLGEGSALNILSDTDLLTEVDALSIRDNAAREAWGHRAQAQNYSSEAGFKSSAADGISPLMAGGSTLLSGIGTVADSWYRYNRKAG